MPHSNFLFFSEEITAMGYKRNWQILAAVCSQTARTDINRMYRAGRKRKASGGMLSVTQHPAPPPGSTSHPEV